MRIRGYRFIQKFGQNSKSIMETVLMDALTDRLVMDFIWKSYLNYDLMTVANNNYKHLFHRQTTADFSLSIFQTAWISALQNNKVYPGRFTVNYGYFHDDATGEEYFMVEDNDNHDVAPYDGMLYDSIASSGMVKSFTTRAMPKDESLALWKIIFKGHTKIDELVPLSISVPFDILLSPPIAWHVDKGRNLMFPGPQSRIAAVMDEIYSHKIETDFDLLLQELEETLDRNAGWDKITYTDRMTEPEWIPGIGNLGKFRTMHHELVGGLFE